LLVLVLLIKIGLFSTRSLTHAKRHVSHVNVKLCSHCRYSVEIMYKDRNTPPKGD